MFRSPRFLVPVFFIASFLFLYRLFRVEHQKPVAPRPTSASETPQRLVVSDPAAKRGNESGARGSLSTVWNRRSGESREDLIHAAGGRALHEIVSHPTRSGGRLAPVISPPSKTARQRGENNLGEETRMTQVIQGLFCKGKLISAGGHGRVFVGISDQAFCYNYNTRGSLTNRKICITV